MKLDLDILQIITFHKLSTRIINNILEYNINKDNYILHQNIF